MVKKKRNAQAAPSSLQDAVVQSLNGEPTEAQSPPEEKSDMRRDEAANEVPEARRKLVERWCKEIRADKAHFRDVFKRMREDQEYARLGADKKWVDGDNYTVPLINRFINQAVSVLYAKNPKAV